MAQFQYTARARGGGKTEGTLEAPDRRSAQLQLESQGLVPISLREAGGSARSASSTSRVPARKKKSARPKKAAPVRSPVSTSRGMAALGRRSGKGPRMKQRELLLFSRELSDLLTSGMKLGSALDTMSRRQAGSDRDALIAALRDEVNQGLALSEALSRRPDTFSTLYVSLIRAGEEGGALAEALESICHHYDRVAQAREKVVMALTYPSIVLIFGILTIVFAMVFVIPRFTAIFDELGGTLPLPTQILIGLSDGMISYGWAVAIVLVIGGVLFVRYIHTPAGELAWHRVLLRLPVVKGIVTANAFAHFARTLGALLKNGVPVLRALQIVEDTVGNAVISREIHEARDQVTDGATISEPLAACGVFPSVLTDMLAVGEETGDMSGSLGHIARRYDGELDRSVQVLTTVLEPILILFIAGMVGFVAISMLMAVFELTSGLGM